jgi:peptidoglycan/xylan/chitin deacetylase (PgdA/CDA1 family)
MIFRSITNKREFLARTFGRVGILRLLECTTAQQRPGLTVLTYHRIAEPGRGPFYDPVISATPEAFRAQLAWFHDHLRLVTLDEVIDQLGTGSPWREPVMLLTFDDGYRDNFELAVPLLREWNAPAAFFIPTAFLETPSLPWWDYVAYVIKQTNTLYIAIERSPTGCLPPLEINLHTTPRTEAIMQIIRAFLEGTIPDERWFLSELGRRCKISVDTESLSRQLFMNWAEVQEIANLGTKLTIGSHTHSHQMLAILGRDAQRAELIGSKQMLETKLKQAIKALAYPYGWLGTYTQQTKTLVAEVGYQIAFCAQAGINRLTHLDRYEVKRLGVGSSDSVALLRARTTLQATFGRSIL